jgi:hypothetical protein
MRPVLTMQAWLKEAEVCGLSVSEVTLHDAVTEGRVLAMIGADPTRGERGRGLAWHPEAPAGMLALWDGTGGWPMRLYLPWTGLLVLLPWVDGVRVRALQRALWEGVDPASEVLALQAQARRAGQLGELGALLPMLSRELLDSLRGPVRLESLLWTALPWLPASETPSVPPSATERFEDVPTGTFSTPAGQSLHTLAALWSETSGTSADVRMRALAEVRHRGELSALEKALVDKGEGPSGRMLLDLDRLLASLGRPAAERIEQLRQAVRRRTTTVVEVRLHLASLLEDQDHAEEEADVLADALPEIRSDAARLSTVKRLCWLYAQRLQSPWRADRWYGWAWEQGLYDDALVVEWAALLVSMHQAERAAELYLGLLHSARTPDEEAIRYARRLADLVQADLLDAERAAALLRSLPESLARDIDVARARAMAARKVSHDDEELEAMEWLLSRGASDPGCTLAARSALLLARRGDIGLAETYLREVCDIEILSPEAIESVDGCVDAVALETGDVDFAWTWWVRRARASDRQDAWRWWAQAARIADQGQLPVPTILQAIDEALRLLPAQHQDPERARALHLLAARYKRRSERIRSAAWHVQRAVSGAAPGLTGGSLPQAPHHPDDLHLQAQAAIDAADWPLAADLLEQLVERSSEPALRDEQALWIQQLADVYERLLQAVPGEMA